MPRKNKQSRGLAFAVPKPTMDSLLAVMAELNRASADFLKIDLETALTFAGIARQTKDATQRQRNLRNARKGYDSILYFMGRVQINADDAEFFSRDLERLKAELETLRETF